MVHQARLKEANLPFGRPPVGQPLCRPFCRIPTAPIPSHTHPQHVREPLGATIDDGTKLLPAETIDGGVSETSVCWPKRGGTMPRRTYLLNEHTLKTFHKDSSEHCWTRFHASAGQLRPSLDPSWQKSTWSGQNGGAAPCVWPTMDRRRPTSAHLVQIWAEVDRC